jgi:RNA polymerase sigma factor (sigma-70 family)
MNRQEDLTVQPKSVIEVVQQAYIRAAQIHSDLGISVNEFADYLCGIVHRYFPSDCSEADRIQFLLTLHLEDLYLTAACCLNQERAWIRFRHLYRSYLQELFYSLYSRNSTTVDVVENLFADMFLPDRSGGKRISQFDGRSSFSTWLSVIVSHRVSNERRRNCHRYTDKNKETYDLELCEDRKCNIEESVQRAQCATLIGYALIAACKALSSPERTLILWRYEEGLQLEQIATRLGVHHSTASRTLAKICRKIREEIVTSLQLQHQLDPQTIRECMSLPLDLTWNGISLISLIKSEMPFRSEGKAPAAVREQPLAALAMKLVG